jgi:sugar lactone lactonase YvrE
MKTKSFISISLALALAFLMVIPAAAFFVPFNGEPASLVLGKPDFTTSSGSNTPNQSEFMGPTDIAVDPTSGKVFVTDPPNHRVLRFADIADLSNGAAAEAVLGQPDFTSHGASVTQNGMDSPTSLAVDASGRLWVGDIDNSRILRFDNAATKANGANADGVLGQPDFTSNANTISQSAINGPTSLAVDAGGRLWVADCLNARVLRFDNAASKANGADADGVLGQPDFTSSTANTTQNGMHCSSGLAVDGSGRLWVADGNRVLRFDKAASKANGADADGVLGKPDFTSNGPNTNQSGISGPVDVTVDTIGRLYISDYGNSRVLIFNAAGTLANGANASSVLGQTNFTTGTSGLSAATLRFPQGIFYDPAAKVLWVTDWGNDRVLMYGSLTFQILPFIGLINLYLPPGTINEGTNGEIRIQTRDGATRTFELSGDVRILPATRAGQIGIGSTVTLLARHDPYTNKWIALVVVVNSAGTGTITPTSTPTDTPTVTDTPVGIPTSTPTVGSLPLTDTPTATDNPTSTPTAASVPPTDTPTPTEIPAGVPGVPPSTP